MKMTDAGFLGATAFCFFISLMSALMTNWDGGITGHWFLTGLIVVTIWLVVRAVQNRRRTR